MLQSSKKRPTIGLLLNFGFYGSFTSYYWPGVADFAGDNDINLKIFISRTTKYFNLEAPYQEWSAPFLISDRSVDGIIMLSGALAHPLGTKGVAHLCNLYKNIPIVGVGLQIGGIPSVLLDNKIGFEKLFDHLIVDHGYKKIAFVTGTPGIHDSIERYEVYRNCLKKHNIPLDNRLVVDGNFTTESGKEAVITLLDERKADFDVLVCSDDEEALGALQELKDRGISVPHDVALTGFDDLNEANLISPPLTTVRQPFYEQATAAAALLLSILQGGEVPDIVRIPTEFIPRQSCGCFTKSILQVPADVNIYNNNSHIIQSLKDNESIIIEKTYYHLKDTFKKNNVIRKWCKSLLGSLVVNLNQVTTNTFLEAVNRFLAEDFGEHSELKMHKKLLLALQSIINQEVDHKKVIDYFFYKVDVLVNEVLARFSSYNNYQRERMIWELHFVGQNLITTVDFDELINQISVHFPSLGFASFYLALFINEDENKQPAFKLPDYSRLILACTNGNRITLPDDGLVFKTIRLLPENIYDENERHTLIYMSLYFGTEHIGYIVLSYGPRLELVYDSLRKNLSSAIKSCLLIEEQKEMRNIVIETNMELKEEISEHIKTEQELQDMKEKAEAANMAKSEFLANMSHEIRTPMNSIMGFSEILMEEERDPGKKSTLRTIVRSGKNLLRLINNILDFSRLEAGKFPLEKKEFALTQTLKHIYDMFILMARNKDINFELNYDDSIAGYFLGDEYRIEQVLINLVGNAFKFTDKGQVSIICFANNNVVTIKIIDTGVGIPQHKQKEIFSSFAQADSSITRKYGGTGLGLSISKNIIEHMKGHIELVSREGEGAIFTIVIPMEKVVGHKVAVSKEAIDGKQLIQKWLLKAQGIKELEDIYINAIKELPEHLKDFNHYLKKTNKEMMKQKLHTLKGITSNYGMDELYSIFTLLHDELEGENLSFHRIEYLYDKAMEIVNLIPVNCDKILLRNIPYKILVVEDNVVNQKLVGFLLERIDIVFEFADNGIIALDKLKNNPDEYNLVLLDMQMPVMDGIQTVKEIRMDKNCKDIYVIALTAHVIKEEIDRCINAGCNDYIGKPINKEQFYMKINELRVKEVGLKTV